MRFTIRYTNEPGWLIPEVRAVLSPMMRATGFGTLGEYSASHWWTVYAEDGKPAGFAALLPEKHNRAFLGPSGVLKKYRGHGLQRRLIRARERFAVRHGFDAMYTYVQRGSEVSANNLLACGFKLYKPQRTFGGPTAYYVEKRLND